YYCKVHQIAQPDQLIKETLAYVGLSNTGKKKFRNFSLGMKQRLGIAIALISKPELMILDEPINGLDPLGIKEFRLMIQRLNQELGITFIISSHILSELYLVATKFGVIDQGRLVAEFTKDDFDRASEDYIVLKTSDR
ncbi:MAG: ATP-binding cassette domain-containing protein, partial [Streptococcus sp.]